jgi:hypothetical protein
MLVGLLVAEGSTLLSSQWSDTDMVYYLYLCLISTFYHNGNIEIISFVVK